MSRSGSPKDQAELLKQFEAQLAGLDMGQLHQLLDRLGGAISGFDAPDHPTPSRRRERRADVVTYRVRVDLTGTKPPLWRRLELASDMHLDELHGVIQIAFGWTDSHLHQFSAGAHPHDRDAERFLTPFDVEEGDEGTLENEVRLDDVLVDVGDQLFYAYDFGDGWDHTVRLEAVRPRDDAAPRATCTAGRRPGPPEDCGGIGGYELFAAANDPDHPHHSDARAEIARVYGADVSPEGLAPTPFDLDQINAELAGLPAQSTALLPEPIADLVHSVRDTRVQAELRTHLDAAALDSPAEIDTDTAERVLRPYTWLLDRVGDDGITLTGAGYLPPAHVEATAAELGLTAEWMGKRNRENHLPAVLHLRESAQKMGLLRKNKGKLLVTARGRRLRTDPVGMWQHIAERALSGLGDCETQAGMILLIGVAAGGTDDLDALVARTLHSIGWMQADGGPIMSGAATWETHALLRRVGGLVGESFRREEQPTPDGITFARAVLRACS
ncbi:hypothetical protein BJF90_07120 [Pseudonocardia sp. CNS-004]|nr:hypothetical protein BJF90_07120 [Pseudonocardia sp. CNS-004]